jgi:hypothetical protein
MNTNSQIIEKAKSRIRFLLRQADGRKLPRLFPMTSYISELIDEQTAQQLYDEIIAELEEASGIKIERSDS